MKRILIANGELVNEGRRVYADILIRNGRIEKIASDLSHEAHDIFIDAEEKLLIPGMIDDQVHFREPGLTQKADIASESAAAVAGGVTSYMDMPNNKPPATDHGNLEKKYSLAKEKSLANYSFYLGADNSNLEEIKSINPKTVCGIKVFMGASTGNMLVDDPKILNEIFKESPILIATHCEDTPTILENEKRFRDIYGEQVPAALHPKIRTEEACYISSSLAIDLAKKHQTKLHVLHITTGKELAHFSEKALSEKQITAEACVHHLFYNEADYERLGMQIKCNPAIKTEFDQTELIQAVKSGKIDIIATDHAPHTWQEKQNNYFKAPSGLPLVQHPLLMLFEFFHDDVFSAELIVEKTSHNVAERYQIEDRGYLREGYFADITVLDTKRFHIVSKENILYKCAWSSLEGTSFRSTVDTTIVSGQIAYQNGKVNTNCRGQRLYFER